MTHEEIQSLKQEFLEEADERYVKVSDCNERQTDINNRFAKDDKRIDKLVDKFNTWDKLLWTIASSAVGALVVALLNLILK